MNLKTLSYQMFGVDRRSLALFRVCMALLLLFDLIDRSTDLAAHYTDFGLLPRAALLEKFGNNWHVSLHLANGTLQWEALLFALAGFFALALLIGWRTRLMTALSWFMLISLHARNPMLLQAGDVLLRLLLFWSMFLPLGARFSVDAGLASDEKSVAGPQLSVAGAALLLQVVFVYWFTLALKNGRDWWPDGTAVYYALNIDMLSTRFGDWLRDVHWLLRPLTYASIAGELLLPVLLLIPVGKKRLRLIGMAGLAGMHASFGLCLELGNFAWIDFCSLLPFLPSCAWDWLGERLRRSSARTGLTLCVPPGNATSWARILRSLFLLSETKIEPATALSRWSVRTKNEQAFYGAEAWQVAARQSPVCGPVLARMVASICRAAPLLPLLKGGLGAEWQRLTAGLLRQRRAPSLTPSPFNQVTATLALIIALWWNLTTVPQFSVYFPPGLNTLGQVFRLDQQWGMFAPFPLKDDGWYVGDGVLRDKTPADILDFGSSEVMPPDFAKPELVSATMPNQRWRKYMMNIWSATNHEHRLYFGKYLCRSWNERHSYEKQLEEFHLYYMREDTLPDFKIAPVQKVEIWHHYCFK